MRRSALTGHPTIATRTESIAWSDGVSSRTSTTPSSSWLNTSGAVRTHCPDPMHRPSSAPMVTALF